MKAKGTDYRRLLKLALPLGAMLLFAAYQLALKPTLESYRLYSELTDVQVDAENLSTSPGYSSRRDAAVDKLYRRYQVDTTSWKNTLWNHCSALTARLNCAVDGFPALQKSDISQTKAFQQNVAFSGAFHDLLQLQHALDTIPGIGVTSEVRYRPQRSGKTTLTIQLTGLNK